ncbi:hypothetical protein BDV37DRAFT_243284 [Aspergillus pseudonomiae]|uniref:Uncharacterized protein n=1 Tax=Aspergillus pseudonomiae TaxID=1506151 RepID=A0A5N7DJF7_9EURO|nr:uncharacterized protein BDV37DRAFT_243284 [Aspergillus pseudonomiae]KAE8406143.1 hypothetical protein BDV37DRAFT_243284 [Aspergillus pseudonomiae]
MKLFRLFTSAALASLAVGTPLRDVILSADTSCQIQGGDEAANLACRAICIDQGHGWTGGYCDDTQYALIPES